LNGMKQIALKTGELAELVTLQGDKATLASPLPSPPGSTVQCAVHQDQVFVGDFQLKVNRCRKVGDLFHIDGRIRNATREVKAELEAGS